jgi:hypothetical protein
MPVPNVENRRDRIYAFEDPNLGRFNVRVPVGTEYATVGKFPTPRTFSIERPRRVERYERDFPIIDVEIEGGQPRCVGIRRRPGGPSLTGELIREVPITGFIRAAAYALAVERAGKHEGADVWRHILGRAAREEFEDGLRPPRRGKRVTDEFLEEVTAVYRAALLAGKPPTRAVAESFTASGGTPGRWVQQARRRGQETGDFERFLGSAEGTKAGEV